MKAKTRVAKTFYSSRKLPVPPVEYWPESFEDLQEAIDVAEKPVLMIGDGRALSADAVAAAGSVVRTEKLDTFLTFDRDSLTARVMSGMRWGTFKTQIRERGGSVSRFRFYDPNATIGGILSAPSPKNVAPPLWQGDLRVQTLALNAALPTFSYRYLGAPRKSSGPDLRSLFVGTGGSFGAIADVTLSVFAKQSGRVATFERGFDDAKDLIHEVWLRGLAPSWCRWADGSLEIALHGPERVVRHFETVVAGLDGTISDEVEPRRDAIEEQLRGLTVSHVSYRHDEEAEIVGSSLHGLLVIEPATSLAPPSWYATVKQSIDPDGVFVSLERA